VGCWPGLVASLNVRRRRRKVLVIYRLVVSHLQSLQALAGRRRSVVSAGIVVACPRLSVGLSVPRLNPL